MDDQRHLLRSIGESVALHVPRQAWDSTVAIVRADKPTVSQFGSGILFRLADESFVVTAGHVMKQAHELGSTLGLSSSTGFFVALTDQAIVSEEGQYGSNGDPFDIAVCKLSQSAVQKLTGKTFLRFEDIEFEPQSSTAVYALFGFPGIWSIPTNNDAERLQLKPFEFIASAYDGDTDHLEGYQGRFHLLLAAELENSFVEDGSPAKFQDAAGADKQFPGDLGGISGCSVWRIGDWNIPISEWGRKPARIVAVQTSVYRSTGVIKATRWIAASTILQEAFPELRPALELWRPR